MGFGSFPPLGSACRSQIRASISPGHKCDLKSGSSAFDSRVTRLRVSHASGDVFCAGFFCGAIKPRLKDAGTATLAHFATKRCRTINTNSRPTRSITRYPPAATPISANHGLLSITAADVLSSTDTTSSRVVDLNSKNNEIDELLWPAIGQLRLGDTSLRLAIYFSGLIRFKDYSLKGVIMLLMDDTLKLSAREQSVVLLWKALLNWSFHSDQRMKLFLDILVYHAQRVRELGFNPYEFVMPRILQENHRACLKWHLSLLERGFSPSKRAIFKLAETALGSAVYLQAFETLYCNLPFKPPTKDLYRILVSTLWNQSRFSEARHWHQILSEGSDIPEDLETALNLFNQNRTHDWLETTKVETVSTSSTTITKGKPGLPLQIPAALPTRLGGDKPPIKWDDDFGAKFFATTGMSINVLLNAAQFLGARELGPSSLREILRRASDGKPMTTEIDRLHELGFQLNDSSFCRLLSQLASSRRSTVLEQLVHSDMPVEVFSDQHILLKIVEKSFSENNWQQLQLSLVALETLWPQEGILWRIKFKKELDEFQLDTARGSLLRMDVFGVVPPAEIMRDQSGKLSMGDTSTGQYESTLFTWVTMKALLVEIINVSGHVVFERWRQILVSFAANNRMQDVRRIGVWLTDIQRFQRFAVESNSRRSDGTILDPVFLVKSDAVRKPLNLALSTQDFPMAFIESICQRSFSTATRYSVASFSRTGYENLSLMSQKTLHNYIDQCVQCIHFIRGLQARGVQISKWQVLRAIHQSYVPTTATKSRIQSRLSMVSNYQKLLKVIQAIEDAWGSPIFENKELRIAREDWIYCMTGRIW